MIEIPMKFLYEMECPTLSVTDLLTPASIEVIGIAKYVRGMCDFRYRRRGIAFYIEYDNRQIKTMLSRARTNARLCPKCIRQIAFMSIMKDYRFDITPMYPNGAFQALRTDYTIGGMAYGQEYEDETDSDIESAYIYE